MVSLGMFGYQWGSIEFSLFSRFEKRLYKEGISISVEQCARVITDRPKGRGAPKNYCLFIVLGLFIFFSLSTTMAYAASDNMIWQNSYGNGSEHGAIVFPDADGGYTLIGDTNSFGDNHVYVVKTVPDGKMETQNNYGPYNGSADMNLSTSDGGYITLGTIDPNQYVTQMTVDKYYTNGTKEWQTIYGDTTGGEGMGSVFTMGELHTTNQRRGIHHYWIQWF